MDDKTILERSLARFISISVDEFEHFYSQLTFEEYARGEDIHRMGKKCDKAFFILEGCFRYYSIVDGEELTGQFFFEEAWYSDYESFLLDFPSEQTIEALEPTRVAVLTKAAMNRLYVELPKFEKFGRLMAENAFIGLRKRTESLTHQSATERYLQLAKTRPKVIRRVPQKHIASYLSIQPQSLSRIRRELAKK